MKHVWSAIILLVAALLVHTPGAVAAEDVSAADRRIDRWSALTTISTEKDLYRLVEEPIVYEEGPLRLTITDGVLVPVFSGRFGGAWERGSEAFLRDQRAAGRPDRLPSADERGTRSFVGFVLVDATATATVRLDDRADAQVLANRLVRFGLSEKDAVAALAHGEEPLTVSVDTGVFLGTDPRLQQLYVGPGFDDPDNPDSDVFGIVVYGKRKGLSAALLRADAVLSRRLRLYDHLGLELPEAIALDRYDGVSWQDSARHLLLVDLKTSLRYGLTSASRNAPGDGDSWLALLRDDAGQWDPRRQWSVRSLGRDALGWPVSGVVGGVPFPPRDPRDPTSAPQTLAGVVPVRAEARILAVPKDQGTLKVDMVTELTVAARGAPLSGMRVEVPLVQAEPDSWVLRKVVLPDGTSLSGSVPVVDERNLERLREQDEEQDGDRLRDADEDDEEDGGGSAASTRPPAGLIRGATRTVGVWIFFPEPVAEGESITFQIHHEDTWGLRTWTECWGERPMGDSTGLIMPLPRLPGQELGQAWPLRLRVAVPDGTGLRAVASGRTTKDTLEKGWRLIEVQHDEPANFPGVAIGRWFTHVDPAGDGLPAVRTHLFSKSPRQLKSAGQHVRQIAKYYRGWLPDFPVPEMDVFEAPAACLSMVWIAPHGMVQLQQMVMLDGPKGAGRLELKFLEEGLLAHEVAHQYWGHLARPYSIEDAWISESFAEGFACMYISKLGGPEVCENKMRGYQRTWEKDLPGSPVLYESMTGRPEERASLTDAYSSPFQPQIVYEYGPFVLHDMLRRKIGTEAYFKALDGLIRLPGPVTAERVQTAMELTSGQDLQPFFDFWVHNGFMPDMKLTWGLDDGGALTGEIVSDVPFGTFEVPVVVHDGDRAIQVVVEVVDGRGELRVPVTTDQLKVELDPDQRIIARGRKVRKR